MLGSLVIASGPYEGVVVDVREDMQRFIVGRSDEADLTLDDTLISRAHLAFYVLDDRLYVEDLQSNNGTYVNGQKITKETQLSPDDTIRAGSVVFAFRAQDWHAGRRGEFTGKKFGRYLVGKKIGSGGMGEVYKAVQEGLGRPAALKILAPELAGDQEYVERFLREARSAGSLDHPNVIHVYDVGEEDGVYYYSMEYVDGGSVQDLISGGRSLSQIEAARIGMETAQALEYAENKGIVHCDVKPDNIMLTSDGRVKLADLGIAKRVVRGAKTDKDPLGVFGSPHFMSPEQAMGKALDHRSDIYSLGASLYRMLTGKTLYPGDDSREIMENQVYGEHEDILVANPRVHPKLAQILRRMLMKRRKERIQSASSIVKSLQKLLPELKSPSNTEQIPIPREYRRRSRRYSMIHLIIVGVVVAVAAVFMADFFASSGFLSQEEVNHLVAGAREAIDNGRPQRALALIEASITEARPEHRPMLNRLRKTAKEKKAFIELRNRKLQMLREISFKGESASTIQELRRLVVEASILEPDAAELQLSTELEAVTRKLTDKARGMAQRLATGTRSRSAFLTAAWKFGAAEAMWRNFPPDAASLAGLDPAAEAAAVEREASSLEAVLRQEAVILQSEDAAGTGQSLLDLFAKRSGRKLTSGLPPAPEQARSDPAARAAFLSDQAKVQEGMYQFNKAAATRTLLATQLERLGDSDGARAALETVDRLNARHAVLLALIDAINDINLADNTITLGDGRSFKVVHADREGLKLEGTRSRMTISWGVLPPGRFLELAAAAPLTPNFALEYAGFAIDKGHGEIAATLAGKAAAEKPSLQKAANALAGRAAEIDPESALRQERELAETTRHLLFKLLERGRLSDAFYYFSILEYRFGRGRGIITDENLERLRKDLEQREKTLTSRLKAAEQLDQMEEEIPSHLSEHAASVSERYTSAGKWLEAAEVMFASGRYEKALEVLKNDLAGPSLDNHPHALLLRTACLATGDDLNSQVEATRQLPEIERTAGDLPPSLAALAGRLEFLLTAGDIPLKHLQLIRKSLSSAPLDAEVHRRLLEFRVLYLPFPARWLAAVNISRALLSDDRPRRNIFSSQWRTTLEEDGPLPVLAPLMLRSTEDLDPETFLASNDPYLSYACAEALFIQTAGKGGAIPVEVLEAFRRLKREHPRFIYVVSGSVERRLKSAGKGPAEQ